MSAEGKTPRVSRLKAELQAEAAALEAQLKPAREFYEQHVSDPRYQESRRVIKEVSAKLQPIQNELAAIARASEGNRGIAIEPGVYSKGE